MTSIFPQPNIIQGYLLGHTAYVTDMVVLQDEEDEQAVVVSIGGDETIRYWKQQALVDTLSTTVLPTNDDDNNTSDSAVPVKLAALNSTTVAVIYDGGSTPCIQLFHITNDKLQAGNVTTLSSPPLGVVVVAATGTTNVYVLLRVTAVVCWPFFVSPAPG